MSTSDGSAEGRDPAVDVPDTTGCTTAWDEPRGWQFPARVLRRSEAT